VPTAYSLLHGNWGALTGFTSIFPEHYALVVKDGQPFSLYPIGPSLFAIPFVILAHSVYTDLAHALLIRSTSIEIEVLTVAFWCACAAAVIFMTAVEATRNYVIAVIAAFIFAFCSPILSTATRALWQHGPVVVCVVVILYLLRIAPRRPIMVPFVAIPVALSFICRPLSITIVCITTVYIALYHRRQLLPFITIGSAIAFVWFAYNWTVWGTLVPFYYIPGTFSVLPDQTWFDRLFGSLISPSRGLFVFSPVFILSAVGCFLKLHRRTLDRFDGWCIALIVAHLFLNVFQPAWWAGYALGPRYTTEIVPELVYLMLPVFEWLKSSRQVCAALGTVCVLCLCATSFLINGWLAVSSAPAKWNSVPISIDLPEARARLWSWKDPQFLRGTDLEGWNHPLFESLRLSREYLRAPFKHPRAAGLAGDLRGNIDLVTVRNTANDKAGRQVEIAGWALTNGRSPANVAVRIDGRLMTETSYFFARADVARALGEASPSGWLITVPARDLASGEHVVAVFVRADGGDEPRLLKESTFTLASENEADRRDRDLANAARRAAKVLVEHQQSPGYWLTAWTGEPRFERPRHEMNTFLNAIMIDVAGPVAEAAGIAQALERARNFLANQIEAGGLVRYHGRPDAPTIGRLGCVITPDADDTALVWRIAPGERRDLLPTALATLGQFRTADGLYRTWLAPKDRYECIDPGKDPNPADIAIQIHVLMLLAQADPPAARALCEALQKRAADEDIWVYYTNAPAILILRLTDLQKAGCPLQLPQTRLQTTVPSQEVWIEAIQHLQRIEGTDGSASDLSETADLLRKLADDEFSLLARVPPLLYHNDLTASVRRFYWSEDLGYALWLRLYFENERARLRLACRGHDAKQECSEK
jgi:hypothetical protein